MDYRMSTVRVSIATPLRIPISNTCHRLAMHNNASFEIRLMYAARAGKLETLEKGLCLSGYLVSEITNSTFEIIIGSGWFISAEFNEGLSVGVVWTRAFLFFAGLTISISTSDGCSVYSGFVYWLNLLVLRIWDFVNQLPQRVYIQLKYQSLCELWLLKKIANNGKTHELEIWNMACLMKK